MLIGPRFFPQASCNQDRFQLQELLHIIGDDFPSATTGPGVAVFCYVKPRSDLRVPVYGSGKDCFYKMHASLINIYPFPPTLIYIWGVRYIFNKILTFPSILIIFTYFQTFILYKHSFNTRQILHLMISTNTIITYNA